MVSVDVPVEVETVEKFFDAYEAAEPVMRHNLCRKLTVGNPVLMGRVGREMPSLDMFRALQFGVEIDMLPQHQEDYFEGVLQNVNLLRAPLDETDPHHNAVSELCYEYSSMFLEVLIRTHTEFNPDTTWFIYAGVVRAKEEYWDIEDDPAEDIMDATITHLTDLARSYFEYGAVPDEVVWHAAELVAKVEG